MRKTSYRNLIPRTVSDAARSAFLCRCRFKTVFRSFRNFYAFRSSAFSTFLRAFDAWKKNEFLDSATRRSLSPRDISPAPYPRFALIRFPARFRVTPMTRPFFVASLFHDIPTVFVPVRSVLERTGFPANRFVTPIAVLIR